MKRIDRIKQYAHLNVNPADIDYLLRVADAGRRLTETLAEDEPRPTDHWYYPEWLDLHETLEEEA